jgi:hypothetical protein
MGPVALEPVGGGVEPLAAGVHLQNEGIRMHRADQKKLDLRWALSVNKVPKGCLKNGVWVR